MILRRQDKPAPEPGLLGRRTPVRGRNLVGVDVNRERLSIKWINLIDRNRSGLNALGSRFSTILVSTGSAGALAENKAI